MDKSAAPARPPYRARRCRDTGHDLMVERARTEGTLRPQNVVGSFYVGVRTKSEIPIPPKTILAVHAATIGGKRSTRPSDNAPELTTQYATEITTAIAPPMRRPPRGHRSAHEMASTASTRLISGNESLE